MRGLGARLTGFFFLAAIRTTRFHGGGTVPAQAACDALDPPYAHRVPILIGIALAGALGAVARYGVDEAIGRHESLFPWGIFVVNITGAFLIGFAVEALEPRFEDQAWVRTAVVTGFLGAYTTFSTLSLDTYRLLDAGQIGQALANSLGSLAAGLIAVWLGLKLGRIA